MHAVFGFGSLMNAESLARGIGRDVSPTELQVARIHGFRRDWALIEEVYSDQRAGLVDAAFLDLRRQPDSWVNGIVVRVDPGEHARLEKRERRYEQLDVTDLVEFGSSQAPRDCAISVFVGTPHHRVAPTTSGPVVLARYLGMVESAVRVLGPEFEAEFRTSTDPFTFPLLPGRYTFGDPVQAANA
jgi:cation transport regulator ChaC